MTAKSLATANSLQPQLHRPKVSFKVVSHEQEGEDDDDMTVVKESDPLPIVELKPFVQKVWRRERSFASTWDRSPSVATIKSDKSDHVRGAAGSRSRDSEIATSVTLETRLDDVPTPSPPPRTSHSLPSRISDRLLTFYINAFEDFKSQKEHFNKFVGESGFRPKSRLHPVIDPKTKKQAEHSVSIIPGFITREDRTKTTLNEISEGESASRFYSCSPKAIGPEEIRKQQQIRISGETVYQFKRNGVMNSPTPTKSMNSSWHAPTIRHGSPASMLYHQKQGQKVKRAKTPLYDYLDRQGTLPSLSINATSLKRKLTKRADDVHSEDYTDYRDAYESEMKHNIGGIENSLMILSKHGSPTKVERQISFELEKNLSRFRKLKDYSPFEINPSELAKYYPTPTFNMTHGEAYIRQAMQSNASKRKQRKMRQMGNSTGTSSYHSGLSNEAHGSQIIHGILKKSFNEIEHIDSFENMYSPYNKLSNVTYTPDEEPNVPFDTPRSHVDSRANSKVAELHVIPHTAKTEEKESKLSDKGGAVSKSSMSDGISNDVTVVHTEAQTSLTPSAEDIKTKGSGRNYVKQIPVPNDSDKNDELGMNTEEDEQEQNDELSNAIDVKAVHMKTAQPTPAQIDASGRTFITSDNIMQVGVVSS